MSHFLPALRCHLAPGSQRQLGQGEGDLDWQGTLVPGLPGLHPRSACACAGANAAKLRQLVPPWSPGLTPLDPFCGFLSPFRCGTEKTSATPIPKAHRGPLWTHRGRWSRSAVGPTTSCGSRSGRGRPWFGKESTGTTPKVGALHPILGEAGVPSFSPGCSLMGTLCFLLGPSRKFLVHSGASHL